LRDALNQRGQWLGQVAAHQRCKLVGGDHQGIAMGAPTSEPAIELFRNEAHALKHGARLNGGRT